MADPHAPAETRLEASERILELERELAVARETIRSLQAALAEGKHRLSTVEEIMPSAHRCYERIRDVLPECDGHTAYTPGCEMCEPSASLVTLMAILHSTLASSGSEREQELERLLAVARRVTQADSPAILRDGRAQRELEDALDELKETVAALAPAVEQESER